MARELKCWNCLHLLAIPDEVRERCLTCPKCQAKLDFETVSSTQDVSLGKRKETPLTDRELSQLTAAGWVLILLAVAVTAASGYFLGIWLGGPFTSYGILAALAGGGLFAIGLAALKVFGIAVFKRETDRTPRFP